MRIHARDAVLQSIRPVRWMRWAATPLGGTALRVAAPVVSGLRRG